MRGTSIEDFVDCVNNFKFFNKTLEKVVGTDEYAKGGGIVAYMDACDEYSYECRLVEKLKLIREVVSKYGDDAIDHYEYITTKPDTTQPLYEVCGIIRSIWPEIDDVFIPIKKSEFEFYLTVYNKIYGTN